MGILKKLLFAIPFLLFLAVYLIQLNTLLLNPTSLLSLDLSSLIKIGVLTGALMLSCLYFTVFVTLALNWKFILPVGLLSLTLPFTFFFSPINYILIGGLAVSLGLVYFLLQGKLSTYITFQPNVLLIPSVKQLVAALLLTSSIVFYLTVNNTIKTQGFQIPPSLIDFVIQTIGADQQNPAPSPQPQLTPEQINLLKQNPQALQQMGIDPSILDQVAASPTPTSDLLKATLEQKVQEIIKPYLSYIPILLAAFFFLTLYSLAALFLSLIKIINWLTFYVLRHSGFVQFTSEMREVLKLTV